MTSKIEAVNSVKRAEVLGQPVDLLTYEKVLERTASWYGKRGCKLIFAQNPEKVLGCLENPELAGVLSQADLLIPDGTGIVWALRRAGYPLPGRVTGIDLMYKLLDQAESQGHSIYLLGGREQVIEKAVKKIKDDFPEINIAGYHHGYFSESELAGLIDQINKTEANLLFTALGSPKQEIFMTKNKNKLTVDVAMGIGGTLDVLSGDVRRAPKWMQKIKLEWFYRVAIDPKRIKRTMKIPRFIWRVLKS